MFKKTLAQHICLVGAGFILIYLLKLDRSISVTYDKYHEGKLAK